MVHASVSIRHSRHSVSKDTKWLLLGLQGTGKTTYLAALWHQLEANELRTAVVAHHLQPDRTYLNRIRNAWLAVEEVPRTSRRAEQSIQLHLQHADAQIEVNFPDPSGEGLATMLFSRSVPNAVVSQARDATGILLFLHPQRVKQGERIPPTSSVKSETPPHIEWKPDLVPTQVQLVDLLQVTLSLGDSSKQIAIAIIVSAWDLVKEEISPEDWVKQRVPLLWQFVASSKQLQSRFFGISAIGGDLSLDQQRLSSTLVAAERATVRDDTATGTDLTLPLQHLLAPGSRS